tara:strand:+ start:1406 stop:2050 length:645 start_codon:yes stop_codon:yes gene_type:complete
MRIVKLKIDDKVTEFKLPTSWDEVSLGQYSKLMLSIEKEGISEIELMIKSLNALVCIDEVLLTKVPLKQLREAYNQLGELISTNPNNELSRVVEIDGIEYGFIPDFDDFTLAEFVDLDNYLQNSWDNMSKIFAVLYRPIKDREDNKYTIDTYTLKDIKERRELFNERLSIDTIYGALVFFCDIGRKRIELMQLSLKSQQKSQSIMKVKKMREIV